jgi:hypothetical protein
VSTASDELVRHLGAGPAEALQRWARSVATTVELAVPLWKASGYSGAVVVAVMITRPPQPPVKLIVKVCPPGPYASETARHHQAIAASSKSFVDAHLVRPVYDPIPLDRGGFILFQDVAGGSLLDCRPMSQLPYGTQVAACRDIARALLHEWNGADYQTRVAGFSNYLMGELGHLLQDGSSVYEWALERGLLNPHDTWILTSDDDAELPMPNPFLMALSNESFAKGSQITFLTGRVHGDLHLDNALIPWISGQAETANFRLIDLSAFEAKAPLTRDMAMLMLSVIARFLPEISPEQRNILHRYTVGQNRDLAHLISAPAEAIDAIRSIGAEYFRKRGLVDEWNAQFLLSIQAASLTFLSFENVPPESKWWFFRLSARAGAEFLRVIGQLHPESPHRIDTSKPPSSREQQQPPEMSPLVIVPNSGNPPYSGITKVEFCRRLGGNWIDLADIFRIPPHERARFTKGNEPRQIWEWLEIRSMLGELRGALRLINRGDLVEILDIDA